MIDMQNATPEARTEDLIARGFSPQSAWSHTLCEMLGSKADLISFAESYGVTGLKASWTVRKIVSTASAALAELH